MRLGEREAKARRDRHLTGAEAFMAGELDADHLLAEHRALQEENERLRADLGRAIRERDEWEANEQEQHREVERLRDALHDYGTHIGLCGARMRGSDCDCGLEELQHG